MAKLSISIDESDLAWLRRRARRVHGGNLYAAVAEGTRLLRHDEAVGEMLDALGAPELTPAELAAAWAELDGPSAARRGPRRRRAA